MNTRVFLSAFFLFFMASAALFPSVAFSSETSEEVGELNPFNPDVEQFLNEFDAIYERETGLSAHPDGFIDDLTSDALRTCYRQSCRVWALVSRADQKLYLYQNGKMTHSWLVSTGMKGYTTPRFDRHPNGRIYDRYSSKAYPGGDYRGLGNMPYAVFIQGGFALHGTPEANWHLLGRRASHGCIRQHPDNGLYFNRLVRSVGIRNVWITVE